jgi:hypothetical protein
VIKSFSECKGSKNWRQNLSHINKKDLSENCKTKNCKYECRDFEIKNRDKDIHGVEVPCTNWIKEIIKIEMLNETTGENYTSDWIEDVCTDWPIYTMFNHTIMLGANQACHIKITNKYLDGGSEHNVWKAAFSFDENDGIAVFIKNFNQKQNSGEEFWTPENTKVDDWRLLVSEEHDLSGGQIPVEVEEDEWHLILLNVKDKDEYSRRNLTTEAFINLRYGAATALTCAATFISLLLVL